jgi:hypothetical protein
MMRNLWYIAKSLFIRNQANFRTEIPHYPELTQFLKSNQIFQQCAWKFYHFKNSATRRLD